MTASTASPPRTLYVAATGVDNGTCGTLASPCRQLAQGQTRALATGKNKVLVGSGSYTSFTLSNGLSVSGGYAAGFASRSGTTTVTRRSTPRSVVRRWHHRRRPVELPRALLPHGERHHRPREPGQLRHRGPQLRLQPGDQQRDGQRRRRWCLDGDRYCGYGCNADRPRGRPARSTTDQSRNSWEVTQLCSNTVWSLAAAGGWYRSGSRDRRPCRWQRRCRRVPPRRTPLTTINCAATAGLVGVGRRRWCRWWCRWRR